MQRREETRFPAGLSVRVTGLDSNAQTAAGTLVDLSVSGICALLPTNIQAGVLVELEIAGTVLYGQVAYAREECGTFRTGITVERVLLEASDLANILEALLDKTEQTHTAPH